MAGTEVYILGKKYVFFGVDKCVTDEIARQGSNERFGEDFVIWRKWMESVTKNDVIVVCDPYKMGSISRDRIAAINSAFAAGEKTQQEIDARGMEIANMANAAANGFAGLLNGNVAKEAAGWEAAINGMFLSYNANTVFGMQYTGYRLNIPSVGSFRTVLFIDFQSVIDRKRELLLPVVIHETTHFLEEISLGGWCFGSDGKLSENVDNAGLWGGECSGSLGLDPEWKGVLSDIATYQKVCEEERMTSLVEKMTIGSLYETGDREWLDGLKEIFREVLVKKGICVG